MLGLPQNSWGFHQNNSDLAGSKGHSRKSVQVALILFGHLILLALGWSFIAVLLCDEYRQITLPDIAAQLAIENPRAVTYIASLAATALSLLSTWLFSKAVLMLLTTTLLQSSDVNTRRKPVYMRQFGFLVTLSSTRPFLNASYPPWVALSIVVLLLVNTTASGWTALLDPTLILVPGEVKGSEVDLTTAAFEALLDSVSIYQNNTHKTIARETNAAQELLSVVTLAGESASGASLGSRSFFDFDGATYNLSTGKAFNFQAQYFTMAEAIPEYAASQSRAHSEGWGLTYAGGDIPLDTEVDTIRQGLSRNYTVRQQGLTASVSCTHLLPGEMTMGGEYAPLSTPLSTPWIGDVGYRYWEMNVSCNAANLTLTYGYITQTSSSGDADCIGTGFLPIMPCPTQSLTGADNNSFKAVINMWGICKYGSIGTTLCQVTPLVTDAIVVYDNGIINQQHIIATRSLGETSPALMAYIVGLVQQVGLTAQGIVGNPVGDTINLMVSSPPDANGTSSNASQASINNVLLWPQENYWRGVIEFGGTYLRSGFSANGNLTADMKSSFSGEVYVLTIGWSKGWSDRAAIALILTMLPQTMVSLLTLLILYRSGGDYLGFLPDFDPSNISDALLANRVNEQGEKGILPRTRADALAETKVELSIHHDGRKILTLKG
ncbi:hypothetical protein CONPUDRAFT_147821 [Coniophora puteana RWD-64-598 SS2]|uniref:Uncharacterized protein n=1 Tax=Coniophora puteana (strain RWD-64-598) TaxID=741705 RepID=R7SDH9_CONPW|nr:uncharacterized protein CONPUDRAFT_147821 [Coniophora puteana RWD-64-598 SS2]EIW74196.1 hypothetical protein CONPUDRAFT_147821 [Coniophora puteana RWD-64-598 SS2]